MNILCCGMIRSASTWSYNVGLEVLKVRGRKVVGVHGPSFEQTLSGLDPIVEDVIFKTHHLDPFCLDMLSRGKALAIYTHRDPLDAIVSGMTLFSMPFENMFEQMAISIRTMAHLMELKTGLFIDYDEICGKPFDPVNRVAGYLRQSLTDSELQMVAGRTSREAMRSISDNFDALPPEAIIQAPENWAYDPKTLLHRNHIQDSRTGKGREQLTQDEQQRVESAFGSTLEAFRHRG